MKTSPTAAASGCHGRRRIHACMAACWPPPRSGRSSGWRNACRRGSTRITSRPSASCRWPAWVCPSGLSGAYPAVGVPLVVVCLALNWFGDSMDGTLARVRNRLRPRYGFYLDHVIDIAGTAMMLAGLAASGHMDPLVAAVTLAAWLLVMGESFLATAARSLFRMSFLWFGPTELRILIAIGALMLLGGGLVRPFGWGPYRLFDVGGVCASAGLVVVFVVNAVRNTVALYREET